MPFVTIYNLFKYIKTLTSTAKEDVMRNVGLAVTYNYLWKSEGDYRDFDLKFCSTTQETKDIDGLSFLIKNEKYDHRSFFGKVLEVNFPCKFKDVKPHEVAIFFPGRIAYSISQNVLDDLNFLDKNELARELESDYQNVLLKQPWFKVYFRGTNPFVNRKLKIEINMVLLCSDTMFCHPDATYWTVELDTSVLVTKKKNTRIDYDVVIEGHWKDGQIVSLVKLNNKVVDTITGYPIILYFFDPWYHKDDEYNWEDNVIELQKILNDIEQTFKSVDQQLDIFDNISQTIGKMTRQQLTAISEYDPSAVTDKIKQLETISQHIQNIQVQVQSTFDESKVEFTNEIFLNIENQGSSFWGSLLGGLAGGAVGALGNALVTAFQTKGIIKAALIGLVGSSIKGVVGNVASLSNNVFEVADALQAFKNKVNPTLEEVKNNVVLLRNIGEIASTLDNLFHWTGNDGNPTDLRIELSKLTARVEVLEYKFHTPGIHAVQPTHLKPQHTLEGEQPTLTKIYQVINENMGKLNDDLTQLKQEVQDMYIANAQKNAGYTNRNSNKRIFRL